MLPGVGLAFVAILCAVALHDHPLAAQVETVEAPPHEYSWVGHGTAEGHLALAYSPAGAFSPDSSQLAVVNGSEVALMDLRGLGLPRVLHQSVKGVRNLELESANFLSPGEIFVLGAGEVDVRSKKSSSRTPELLIRWDIKKDAVVGNVQSVNAAGDYSTPRWFPDIRYMGMSKQNIFEMWDPATGKGGRVVVPPLTRGAGQFVFSPDGRWLLLAQIESSSQADPIVVGRPGNQFENVLKGHTGTVESMEFSHDSSKVVTACADGKVRIYSTASWSLERTLEGHDGTVHWAEFSPNGQWVVSAGEDKTVRVWSATAGELLQTLKESPEPVLTAAFSPNSEFIAASTAKKVLVWQRTPGL
jgi:WD40 repeat protein